MPRCTFCGIQIPKSTGKLFVYSSGKTASFCKSKCEKNFMALKRKPLNVRWTEHYRKEHKKSTKEEKATVKEEVKTETPTVEEKVPEEKKEEPKEKDKPAPEAKKK